MIAGLFIGGLMPFLFASLAMQAVGQVGGQVVEEVRRQFREIRDPRGDGPAGLLACGRHRHDVCDQADAAAGVDSCCLPDRRRDHLAEDARRAVDRHDRDRALPRDRDDVGGGARDNAKKLIEDGAYGGGSEAHAASVTGDTVGDPYKDTAGPAINPMIKIANVVAILIIPLGRIHG